MIVNQLLQEKMDYLMSRFYRVQSAPSLFSDKNFPLLTKCVDLLNWNFQILYLTNIIHVGKYIFSGNSITVTSVDTSAWNQQ